MVLKTNGSLILRSRSRRLLICRHNLIVAPKRDRDLAILSRFSHRDFAVRLTVHLTFKFLINRPIRSFICVLAFVLLTIGVFFWKHNNNSNNNKPSCEVGVDGPHISVHIPRRHNNLLAYLPHIFKSNL